MEMAKVSTAQKMGIATRIASRQLRKSRTYGAISAAGRATFRHIAGVTRQLWLEVTGFVFLFLAGIGLIAFIREYMKFHAGHAGSSRTLLAACFMALFGWFGVSSFWRVRKKG